MSMRTVVEFNHDRGRRIEDKKDEFINLIGMMIRGGPSEYVREHLEYFGVEIAFMAHHSDERTVSVNGAKRRL